MSSCLTAETQANVFWICRIGWCTFLNNEKVSALSGNFPTNMIQLIFLSTVLIHVLNPHQIFLGHFQGAVFKFAC